MSSANFKQPALKQKTLLGFFNKSASSTTSSSKEKTCQPAAKNKDNILKTPPSKAKSRGENEDKDDEDTGKFDPTSSVGSSFKSYGSRISGDAKNTPPTSDIIDIDIVSDLTDEEHVIAEKPVSPLMVYGDKSCILNVISVCLKKKRKKGVVDVSEDEKTVNVDKDAYDKGLSAYKPSPDPEELNNKLLECVGYHCMLRTLMLIPPI